MTETANSFVQQNAEGILGLAQKLYDEHVSEGESIKNRLITEAEAEAERILSEAQSEAGRLRSEADEYYETTLKDANREVEEAIASSADRVNAIHENISSLQKFEARYRAGLNKLIADTQSLLDSSFVSEDEETEGAEDTPVDEQIEAGTVKPEVVESETNEETVEDDENSEDVYNQEYDEVIDEDVYDEDDNKRSFFVA